MYAILRTALILIAAGTACARNETRAAERREPQLCLRETPTIPFVAGDTATLEVGPVDANDSLCAAPRGAVNWRSSTPGVASVDPRGLLRALTPGRTTISVATGEQSDSATMIVVPAIRDVRIVPDSVTLAIGDSVTFHIVTTGEVSTAPVWWYSSDALISFGRPGARDPVPVSVTAESVTVWATQPGLALLEAGTRYLRDAAHIRIVVR